MYSPALSQQWRRHFVSVQHRMLPTRNQNEHNIREQVDVSPYSSLRTSNYGFFVWTIKKNKIKKSQVQFQYNILTTRTVNYLN